MTLKGCRNQGDEQALDCYVSARNAHAACLESLQGARIPFETNRLICKGMTGGKSLLCSKRIVYNKDL